MEAEFNFDGVLYLIAVNGVEQYALQKWNSDRLRGRAKVEIIGVKDANYMPICVELTKMMTEERDAFRAWQTWKKQKEETK